MNRFRRAAILSLLPVLLAPALGVPASAETAPVAVPVITEPAVPVQSPGGSTSAPNAAVAATIAQVKAYLHLGDNYQIQPELALAEKIGSATVMVQWMPSPESSIGGASAQIETDTGTLRSLSIPIVNSPGNPTAKVPTSTLSWEQGIAAARKVATQFGGSYYGKCSPDPTVPDLFTQNSNQNGYIFRRLVNGIPVYEGGLEPEGIMVLLDSSGKLQEYSLIWSHDLTFPSPQGILSPAKAQVAWEKAAAPALSVQRKVFFYPFPSSVDAFSGKSRTSSPALSLPGSSAPVVTPPTPPVTADAATAYLEALGLLSPGQKLSLQSEPGFYESPMTEPGFQGPAFSFQASQSVPGTTYAISYDIDFNARGLLTQFSLGYEGSGIGGMGMPPGLPTGGINLPESELQQKAADFLAGWSGINPSDWRLNQQTSLGPPGYAYAGPSDFVVSGVYAPGGVRDLNANLNLMLNPVSGQVINFFYTAPTGAPKVPAKVLSGAAVTSDFLKYFQFVKRYDVENGQVDLIYTLGDRRGAEGIRATDGAPIDVEGRDISIYWSKAPSDVPSWAEKAVTFALKNFLLSKEPSGNFDPSGPVTPREALAALVDFRQSGQVNAFFPPMSSGTFFFNMAKQQGLTTKDWSKATSLSRARFAVWLARALGFQRLLAMPTVLKTPYSDLGSLPTDQQNAIALLSDLGFFRGSAAGRFEPSGTLTRVEFAVVMNRLAGE